MGRDRGKKTKPKNNSFQTIAFYSMYRARRAEHPGTAGCDARARTRRRLPQTEGTPPALPWPGRDGGGQGWGGTAGAAAGRGSEVARGEPHRSWGGQRTRKPLSWGAGKRLRGAGALHPGCLRQSLSVLVPR